MTLRHMKIFRAVCENDCNTTRAAEKLHLPQSGVSVAIKELENYYGVHLFDRFGRRLYITEAGKKFLKYAVNIVDMFDMMEKELRDWNSSGILRVGSSITIGSKFLPDYVNAFSREYPNIEVHVQIVPGDLLEQKILHNELDLALIEGIPRDPSLSSEQYMTDTLTVISAADGSFEPNQVLSIDEFRKQKFLLREKGSGTREVFDRVTENAGFSVTPLWEAVSTTALVNAVISGLGIAVLPQRMVEPSIKAGLIVPLQIKDLDFHRYFYIITHKDKFLSPIASAFINLCKNYEKT